MDRDFNVPSSQPTIGRRGFVMTLVSGFTLATGPLNAETIVTDTNGLDAGEVKIAVADGMMPGYRVRPKKGKNFPVVLVVHEVFGVH